VVTVYALYQTARIKLSHLDQLALKLVGHRTGIGRAL
jgi:hypothetical protein